MAASKTAFRYNGTDYNIVIIKKNNKNTYMRVKNNEIIITTNYLVSNNKIDKLIKDNEQTLIKMINNNNKKEEKKKYFYLWGNIYDIIYNDTFKDVIISKNKIYSKNIKSLDKYLRKEIAKTFTEHLNYWYNVFEEKIPVPNLKIRKMTSRWGVCNLKNNNVTLNLELFKYNISCLDYVIIHELSHFKYPNHSKKFWILVSKYCPNYKILRNELKK